MCFGALRTLWTASPGSHRKRALQSVLTGQETFSLLKVHLAIPYHPGRPKKKKKFHLVF